MGRLRPGAEVALILSSIALAVVSLRVLTAAPATPQASTSFTAFESGLVRPLALSTNGARLYAVNTPDGKLEIFDAGAPHLARLHVVPVGLEPVAVALRGDTEAWVVNHLSDSVSIVDLTSSPPRVVRTLLVGDEPSDIVFAGPGRNRAFVSCAHRGQNAPPPQLQTPGVGRADVWVFDAEAPGGGLGGAPIAIVTLFGDTPRGLAVSPDGSKVYASIFHSGNRTTTVHEGAIPDGELPPPRTNAAGDPAPETGLIVQHDGTHWVDELGRSWDAAVKFSLPDEDVFTIDALADPPVEIGSWSGVGTTLFHLAVNPASGDVFVAETEARNEVRFEGPGTFAGTTVRGHIAESRIAILSDGQVRRRHLNKHIDYGAFPGTVEENARSLAFPVDLAFSADGTTLYVAALGSSKVGVFATEELVNDTFVPSAASQIPVSGGGPSGLAIDDAHQRLYVLTRFDNAITIVDLGSREEVAKVPLYNPEPESLVAGRRFLYDAALTSSRGDSACASCHVFGDLDQLAWDLGNPDGEVINNPNPFVVGPADDLFFHPMKGPMSTQSLRGMAKAGPMHWRGDRTGGNDPGGDALDEEHAFKKFNVAFEGLLGRTGPLDDDQMQAFTDFILQLTYPPNPIRALDNSLTSAQLAGRNTFGSELTDGNRCGTCHTLNRLSGFFGTGGGSSFDGEPQNFKVPHLRNMYQKVGMFGMPDVPTIRPGDNGDQGPQIRGFGFSHDGAIDTIPRFLKSLVFQFSPDPDIDAAKRSNLAEFMFAFDSDLAPVVGQQVTLRGDSGAAVAGRIDLLVERCRSVFTTTTRECDLVVKGNVGGLARGYLLDPDSGQFHGDRIADPPLDDAALRALAATPGQELTFTAVPPGNGPRIGIDRDKDGQLDRDELDAGSDPGNPLSIPLDRDGDGSLNAADCAPDDASIHPGAAEVCNQVDDDCANGIDDGLPTPTWHLDADADGFGGPGGTIDRCGGQPPAGYAAEANDCNDADASIHPGALDLCDGANNDCAGAEDDPPCAALDLDGSGRVDGFELAQIGRAFGTCAPSPADLDGDGCVDGMDLAALASVWARSCSGGTLTCP